MTEEERAKLIEAKQRVTDELAKVDVRAYALGEVDPRLSIYVGNVCHAPLWHNLYEQLAVARFLRHVETYGINVKAVQKFIRFYEQLRLPGKNGPQCYTLTPVQVFQFANIYGFSRDGKRLTREACLYVPRKFSKTTSTAAIAIYDFLLGDNNAEVYVGANSQDQAKKCFDVIRIAMRHLDPEQTFFTINEQAIKTRLMGRTAIAQCLTSNVRTKDGLNASTVIMDEFSQAKDIGLLSVLTTSMGVRRQPLTVIITTASDKYDAPFYSMLQGYKKMLLGEVEDDPTVFAHIFEPDLDDAESDPATWHKVQPHIGVTVSEDFYLQEYTNAKRNGADAMLAFRTKLLNVYSESSSKAWIPASLVREYMRPMRVEEVHNFPVATVAVDLSVRDDFSAVSCCIYHAGLGTMSFITDYFFPSGALPGHPNEALYRKWAEDGWLHLIPAEVIDYGVIADHIIKWADFIDIRKIGYDPYKSELFCNTMRARSNAADLLTPVNQTNAHFTAPVEMFEHGIRTGGFNIGNNPITAYCFGNATLDVDSNTNTKPVKRTQSGKIDGVITMLMSLKLIQSLEWE